jgi:phage-related protein
MTASQEEQYRQEANVVARRVGGETLLVPTRAKTVDAASRAAQLYVLNETGERMWQWLADPNTTADLARKLMREFEVTEQAALDDAETFVRSLEAAGLVVRTQNGN